MRSPRREVRPYHPVNCSPTGEVNRAWHVPCVGLIHPRSHALAEKRSSTGSSAEIGEGGKRQTREAVGAAIAQSLALVATVDANKALLEALRMELSLLDPEDEEYAEVKARIKAEVQAIMVALRAAMQPAAVPPATA